MSTPASSSPKVIVLKSCDGEDFEVSEAVAMMSETIKSVIQSGCTGLATIPVPNVAGRTLAKVIEYCKKHVEAEAGTGSQKPGSGDDDKDDLLMAFDAEFVNVEQGTLFDLILAANYLNVKSLLDLTCQTVANMIRGRSPQEIRNLFGLVDDFDPEEEAAIHAEHPWAFDG